MNESTNNEQKKAAWLEKRRGYITGTDAAGLLGISKWTSAYAIWLEKRGEAAPLAENEAMKWGKRLERDILQAYADSNPNCVFEFADGYDLKTNPEFPRLGASLDGWNVTLNCPVDAKNIRQASTEWGDAGTDQFPDYYKTQLSVQMAVTGAKYAQLAVLFSGQDFRIYTMERDDELIAKINSAAEEFWARYIDGDEIPPLGGDETSTKWVKDHLSVGKNELEKKSTPEIVETVVKLKAKKDQAKELMAEIAELENQTKAWIGDASICPGLFTFKNNKDKIETDWEAVAKEFSHHDNFKDVVEAHTEKTAGNRVLRIFIK